MTTSRLQQVIAEYRQQLKAREAHAQAALSYAHQQTLKLIEPQLERLYQQIADAQANGEDISKSWLYEQNRLQTIDQYIRAQIDHFGALTQMQVEQLQHFGVQLGQKAGMALLDASVPTGIQFAFGIPSQAALANLIGATQKGSPLADLFNGFGAEAAQKAKDALISGVTLGYGPRQIAPSVQDALNISRNRALVISRNEMNRSYRSANLETFRANSDVVSGWRWTASLSGRTCAACLAEDGTEHGLDEELDEHVCGRCTAVPITRSWSDILSPLGIDTTGIDETSPVDGMQSGSDWFSNQDEATQRGILGNKGYDLYANGDATLQDFVGHKSDPVWGDSIYQRSIQDILAMSEDN